eukprot:Hpha_TRINITY_DN16595_c2_g4::TRINITY_DN16595_c2_g4_i1::g.132702::m.132702/K18466/VPS26; vacuolar protein sorting-associated protein 26
MPAVLASLMTRSGPTLQTELDPADCLPGFEVLKDGQVNTSVYGDGARVRGTVTISPRPGTSVEHSGVRAELHGWVLVRGKGLMGGFWGGGRKRYFSTSAQILLPEGRISEPTSMRFNFEHIDAPYESYTGDSLTVSYSVVVTVSRRLADVVEETPVWVRRQTPSTQWMNTALCPSLLSSRTNCLWSRPYSTFSNRRPSLPSPSLPVVPGTARIRGHSLPARPSAPMGTSTYIQTPLASATGSFARPRSLVEKREVRRSLVVERPVELWVKQIRVGFERNMYHTSDIVRGVIRFCGEGGVSDEDASQPEEEKVVSSTELRIVRREWLCSEDGEEDLSCLSSAVLFTSEIVDGDPELDCDLPFSLPLRGLTTLTPTYIGVDQRVSVRYFFGVLVRYTDGTCVKADREIWLWRLPDPPPAERRL